MSKHDKRSKLTSLPSFSIKPTPQPKISPNLGHKFTYKGHGEQDTLQDTTNSDLSVFLNRNSINNLLLEYPIQTLSDSTDHFNDRNCLGHGSFGKVYKGNLYGTLVAVKVLFSPKKNDFMKEVSALSKYRHPNLVMLMGYAIHHKKFYLIFEQITKGDLRARLLKGDLTWKERVSIMLDTATGLSYLHNSQPKCFHRDVKASNILISESGAAKVADFGLARLASTSQNFLKFKASAGTIGYADPYYVKTRTFSELSEVYSFGMLLLEVLTSRSPAERKNDGSIDFLITFINNKISKILSILDPTAQFPISIAVEISKLALRCTDADIYNRPKFLEIIDILRNLLEFPSYVSDTSPSLNSEILEMENNSEYYEYTEAISRKSLGSENIQESRPLSETSLIHKTNPPSFNDSFNSSINDLNMILTEQHNSPTPTIPPDDTTILPPIRAEIEYPVTLNSVEHHINNSFNNSNTSTLHQFNEVARFQHPMRDEIERINSHIASEREDEFDQMLLKLSMEMSIEEERSRKQREIEDQRELQAALDLSRLEYDLEKSQK